jgi:hypothetical protein
VFVIEGKIDIGFALNHRIQYKLRLTNANVIGFYECAFNQRSLLIYKSKTMTRGYFIRKKNWFYINQEYPKLTSILSQSCLINFKKRISNHMIFAKEQEVSKLKDRADISQILTLKINNNELNRHIISLSSLANDQDEDDEQQLEFIKNIQQKI